MRGYGSYHDDRAGEIGVALPVRQVLLRRLADLPPAPLHSLAPHHKVGTQPVHGLLAPLRPLRLTQVDGTPREDAPKVFADGTGSVAGLIQARWSETETIAVSFTAPCRENEYEAE